MMGKFLRDNKIIDEILGSKRVKELAFGFIWNIVRNKDVEQRTSGDRRE